MDYPPPPDYYKQYTEQNVQNKTAPPPPPPVTGTYEMFGRLYLTENRLPTLQESNIVQLYSESGDLDHAEELKKLNASILMNYIELISVLTKAPNQFAEKIEHIRTIAYNLHHLLNQYRPHQARETLKMMMESQISKRREHSDEIVRSIDAMKNILKEQFDRLMGGEAARTIQTHAEDEDAKLSQSKPTMSISDTSDPAAFSSSGLTFATPSAASASVAVAQKAALSSNQQMDSEQALEKLWDFIVQTAARNGPATDSATRSQIAEHAYLAGADRMDTS